MNIKPMAYKVAVTLLILFNLTIACSTQQDAFQTTDIQNLNEGHVLFYFSGVSMMPLIPNEAVLIIDQRAYTERLPQRGEIVVYSRPSIPENLYAQRIIGLPGEFVETNKQGVAIDGNLLNEPYVQEIPTYQGSWTLEENEYFILGDNRNISGDSHVFGGIQFADIEGKAVKVCSSRKLDNCRDL